MTTPSDTNQLVKIQVKVCGLTHPGEAAACARLGVDAIGCVFFPKSPRNVSAEAARDVFADLPPGVNRVGVFVNETDDHMLAIAARSGLDTIQLHGQESPELVDRLSREGFTVIKAVFIDGRPSLADASDYNASAFLVECARGPLPGGNAMAWNWGEAREFGRIHPFVLAGGLRAETIQAAVTACRPDAVDVSSGVEASPGRKDMTMVTHFVTAVSTLSRPGAKAVVFGNDPG